jgi:deoxycytidylate deaminase
VEETAHGQGPYDDCIYVHAERNALDDYRHAQGFRHMEGWARGAVVYVTTEPCPECRTYASWAGAEIAWERA